MECTDLDATRVRPVRRRVFAIVMRLLDLDLGAVLDHALDRVEAELILVDGAHDVEDPGRELEARRDQEAAHARAEAGRQAEDADDERDGRADHVAALLEPSVEALLVELHLQVQGGVSVRAAQVRVAEVKRRRTLL